MMTSLFIRAIGGICGGVIGTYVTGQIYDYIYTGSHNSSSKTNHPNKNKSFQNAESFEEILNMEIIEKMNGEYNGENKDKDKDICLEIKPPNPLEIEIEYTVINDAIYDNQYVDFYSIYFNTFEEE